MKTKFLKFAVLACSLAFMNCDDTTSASANDISDPAALSSGQELIGSSDTNLQDPNLNSSSSVGSFVNPGDSLLTEYPTVSSDTSLTPPVETNPSDVSNPGTAPSSDSENPSLNQTSSSTIADTPVAESSSQTPVAESSSSAPAVQPAAKKIFLASETSEDKDGVRIEYKTETGPDGKSILAYPSELSNDQKHAIVVWGPGGDTAPSAYEGIIRRLASHGFVVIAIRESPGSGKLASEALDWLEKENQNASSPLNGKLEMNTVGCSGHSMGGLESEQAVINDKRVITAMLNNSGDLGHSAMGMVPTEKTIGVVYGEGGMERPNAEADYNNPAVKAPACLIKMTGGQGSSECQNGECGWGHGSGPWGGMAATVAWMRWHLGGEDFRKADFVGQSGKYIDGNINGQPGKWKGQCKNF